MQRRAGAKLQGRCLSSEVLTKAPCLQFKGKGEIYHCPTSPVHSEKNTRKEEERGEEKGELIMNQA